MVTFREIDLLGIYVAPMAIYLVISALLWVVLHTVLIRIGLDRLVWHRSLFNLALFIGVLSTLILMNRHWSPW
jgi:hypothetical protein